MKQKDLLFILLSSTLLVGLWIVFSVVHNTISSTISEGTALDIAPINASFDTKTLDTLKKRTVVNPADIVALTPTPTPTPTPPPVSPVSPLQSLSVPVATQGGTTQ